MKKYKKKRLQREVKTIKINKIYNYNDLDI